MPSNSPARHGKAIATSPSHNQESKPLLLPVSSPVGELSSSSSRSSSTSPSSPSPRFRDWLRPTKATATTSALLDVWVPWLAYLGLGVGTHDFILGGLVAAGVAMLGFLFQAYRFHGQKSLRTWPKVHAVGVLLTWVGNAVFVAGLASDGEVATRYSLLVVISGVVLSNLFSLALGHPALLDEAREHVSSEAEERHPLFIRMHTMASYMLLVLSLFQWPCFYLAAVVYPNDNALAPFLLLLFPVGSLFLALVLITLYLRWQQTHLARALRYPLLQVDEEEGGREGMLPPKIPLLTSL